MTKGSFWVQLDFLPLLLLWTVAMFVMLSLLSLQPPQGKLIPIAGTYFPVGETCHQYPLLPILSHNFFNMVTRDRGAAKWSKDDTKLNFHFNRTVFLKRFVWHVSATSCILPQRGHVVLLLHVLSAVVLRFDRQPFCWVCVSCCCFFFTFRAAIHNQDRQDKVPYADVLSWACLPSI